MLTLKELNDRSYQEILESSREMIPHIFPQWTDLRAHDPGITFVELFAWLTQMMEDRQNDVTLKNRLKFLKLMNAMPLLPRRAMTYVTISDFEGVIPEGTKVEGENVVFETSETINLHQMNVIAVFVEKPHGLEKVFDTIQKRITGYPAFGANPGNGDALVIGFDNIHDSLRELSLNVEILQNKWPRNSISKGDTYTSLAKLKWEYRKNGLWRSLEVIEDETHALTFSGIIKLRLPDKSTGERLPGTDDEERHYIRGIFECGYYETPPVVKNIYTNTVKAVHGDTLSRVYYFSGTGSKRLVLKLEGYLPFYGTVEVKVRESDGYWHLWEGVTDGKSENSYIVKRKHNKTYIIFGVAEGRKVPSRGRLNIMVTAFQKSFAQNRQIKYGTPLPNQVFKLNWALNQDNIYPDSFHIQVGNKGPFDDHYKWSNYIQVNDFTNSHGRSKHFVFDPIERELHFGNNEKGALAGGFGENIIQITSCTLGGGYRGNIKENILNRFCSDLHNKCGGKYNVINYCPAVGGRDGESVEEAFTNLIHDMKKQYRAVTPEDYEESVRATPGLMVARVKALPEFSADVGNYSKVSIPGRMTVVAAPYSTDKIPVPGESFLARIKEHLNNLRLITTEIDVIPPLYIGIEVSCSVVVTKYIQFRRENIVNCLEKYITPMYTMDYPGWPFGERVRKSEIIARICEVDGVEYVEDIRISAEGSGISIETSGDIDIPPHALVYLQNHDIRIWREEI